MLRALWTGCAAIILVAGVASAQEMVLNVYNWSDYSPRIRSPTSRERTGIKVNYDVFDSNEVLEAKLLAGNSGYDVVVPAASFLERQITAGSSPGWTRAGWATTGTWMRPSWSGLPPTIPATSTRSRTCGGRPASATTSARWRRS